MSPAHASIKCRSAVVPRASAVTAGVRWTTTNYPTSRTATSCISAMAMAKLNVFHIMLPSIYNQFHLKDKSSVKTRLKLLPLTICAIVVATLVTLTVFCASSNSSSAENQHKVAFLKRLSKHPKNIYVLDNQDVFISVKTTHKNHQSRLPSVLQTWYQLARDHTWFFTDQHDEVTESQVNRGHFIVTECGDSHSRQDLCCKMSAEFDAFLESNKK